MLLELTSGAECIAIPIMSLTLCPVYWDIQPPYIVDNIRLSGYFFPTLTVDSPGFIVANRLSNTAIAIPQSLRLSQLSAKKVHRIIRQPFAAYILIVHHGYYKILDPPSVTIPS